MPIFRDKLHLGRKVPQMQTDDYSDQSVTRRKLAREVTEEIESKASKTEVEALVTEERARAKAAEETLQRNIDAETTRAQQAEAELRGAIAAIPETVQVEVDGELSETSENPVQNKVVTAALGRTDAEVAGLKDKDAQLQGVIDSIRQRLEDIYELYAALSAFIGEGYDDEDVEDYIQGIEGMPSLTDIVNRIQSDIAEIREKGVSINEEDQKRLEDAIKTVEDLKKLLEEDDSDRATIKATIDELGGRIEVIGQSISDGSAFTEVYARIDAVEGVMESMGQRVDAAEGTVTDFSQRMDAAEGSIANAVSRIDTVSGEVTTVSQELNATKGSIETLVSKTEGYETRFSEIEQTAEGISQTVAAVKTYAEEGLGGLDEKIETNASQIRQTAESITTTVESAITVAKGEIELTYAKFSDIEQTADEIKSTVSAVQKQVDDLAAGEGADTSYFVTQSQLSQKADEITATVEERQAESLNDLDTRVNINASQIRQTAESISLTVSSAIEDFENDVLKSQYVTKGQLKVTADGITAEVGTSKDHADNAAKAYADAKTAQEAAEQAKKDAADSAKQVADTYAQFKVDSESITGTVSSYAGDADVARQLAEAARNAAQGAQSGAEGAKTGAEAAKKLADELKAQTLQYKNDAETAKGAAVTAKTEAESAKRLADEARDKALEYKDGAMTAKDAAEEAQSGAETAEGNAKSWNTAAEGVYSRVKQEAASWSSTIQAEVVQITEDLEDLAEGKTAEAFNEMDVRVKNNSSAIQQTQDNIKLWVNEEVLEKVDGKLTNYASKSEVELLKDKIGLIVETENGQSKVKGSVIVENITDANGNLKSQIGLTADHINAVAKDIKLSADNITIGNIGSDVKFGGTLTAPKGTIGGFTLADNALENTRKMVRFKEDGGCGYLYECFMKPDGMEYVEYHPATCFLNNAFVMNNILAYNGAWALKKTTVNSHGVRMYSGSYNGSLSGLSLDAITWTLASRFEENVIMMQDIKITNTDITLIKNPVSQSLTMTWQEIYTAVKNTGTSVPDNPSIKG